MSHLQPKERLQAPQGDAHLQQAVKGGTHWGPQAHLFALCLHQYPKGAKKTLLWALLGQAMKKKKIKKSKLVAQELWSLGLKTCGWRTRGKCFHLQALRLHLFPMCPSTKIRLLLGALSLLTGTKAFQSARCGLSAAGDGNGAILPTGTAPAASQSTETIFYHGLVAGGHFTTKTWIWQPNTITQHRSASSAHLQHPRAGELSVRRNLGLFKGESPARGKTTVCLLAPGAESFFSSCGKGNIYSKAFLSALQVSHAASIKAA